MQAKDIMSKNPDILSPESSLQEAADHMKNYDCGFLPIGENDRLVGAITDRDIIIRAIASGKDSKQSLREFMTPKIHYCFENDSVENIANQMEKLQIRRLVVLNKDKRITGIISLGDIATKCKDIKLCSELTEAVSQS